jgi:RNA polymerase sigma-70 factor, ECF subfamily
MEAEAVNEVIDRVLRGERDAFREIVRAYSLPVRGFLAGQLYHLDDADDLAQEVFIAAYRNLASFRRGEDFGAWLRGIARNRLYNHFRSHARRAGAMERFRTEVVETLEQEIEQASAGDRSETIEALLRCISRLPERLRHVVRSGLEGEKAARVASDLGTSVGAVYTLQWRANKLLRECVQGEAGRA